MNTKEIIEAINSLETRMDLCAVISAAQKKITTLSTARATEERIAEPCYGLLSFSRCQANSAQGLFGSNIGHETIIKMTVKRAYEGNWHGCSHYFGDSEIVEVAMSYSQFAEAISSFNVGEGVPVTLRYTEIDGSIPAPKIPNVRSKLDKNFSQHINECVDLVSKAEDRIKELFSKKSLTKGDKEELLSLIGRVKSGVGHGTAFAVDEFHKHMEKIITEAKTEVEAFAENKLHSIAMAALANQNVAIEDSGFGVYLEDTKDETEPNDPICADAEET